MSEDALKQKMNYVYSQMEVVLQKHNDFKQLATGVVKEVNIPELVKELKDVLDATEEASVKILQSATSITEMLKKEKISDKTKQSVTASLATICEACGFQDITGQRVKKVLKRISEFDENFKQTMREKKSTLAQKPKQEAKPTDVYMNGPQLTGKGLDQDEIDRLLAE